MKRIPKKKPIRQSGGRKKAPKPLRSLEQFNAQSAKQQQLVTRVAHALTSMRTEGLSLSKAARVHKLDARTIVRYAKGGLRKGSDQRYVARASDSLLRVLVVPTSRGLAEIAIRGSRDATKIGKYWDAVQGFLETGDSKGLRAFRGVVIQDASGARIPLITNANELERLGSAGVISFESIYAKASF